MTDTALSDWLPEARNILPPVELQANIEAACKRGLPEMDRFPAHDLEAVLCAGGPSLKRGLSEIRRRILKGAMVVGVNAVSGYLLENGVVPRAVVLLDPQELLVGQFAADPRITYLVASQCHAAVFDKLKDCPVRVWHAQDCGAEWEIITRHYPDALPVGEGTTAALRTFGILHAQGFRKIHVYGLDGSFEPDAAGWLQHHAYQQTEDDAPPVKEIIVRDARGEKRFLTRPDYARQANEFMDVLTTLHKVWKIGKSSQTHVWVHGDGLIPYIWKMRRHELG